MRSRRLVGPNVVYMAKRESVHSLRLYCAIGRHLPAHATALGKALLAGYPDAAVDQLLTWPLPALTPRSVAPSAFTTLARRFGALTSVLSKSVFSLTLLASGRK